MFSKKLRYKSWRSLCKKAEFCTLCNLNMVSKPLLAFVFIANIAIVYYNFIMVDKNNISFALGRCH